MIKKVILGLSLFLFLGLNTSFGECTCDWTRDTVNGYIYQTILSDKIGIGTNTPISDIHIEGENPSLTFHDTTGGGNRKRITFRKADNDKFYIQSTRDASIYSDISTNYTKRIEMDVDLNTVFPSNVDIKGELITNQDFKIGTNKLKRDINNFLYWSPVGNIATWQGVDGFEIRDLDDVRIKIYDGGKVAFRNYSFPIGDGYPGDVLATNGEGQIYWSTPTTSTGTTFTGATDSFLSHDNKLITVENGIITDISYLTGSTNTGTISIIYPAPTYTGSTTSQLFGFYSSDGGYYINYSLIFTVLAWFWAVFFISFTIIALSLKFFKLGLKK